MHFYRFSNIFLQAALQIRRYAERLFPWSLAVFLVFTLTACGNERISSDFLKETGEFYSSDVLSSTRSGHSEEERKLQADFDAFCTELFQERNGVFQHSGSSLYTSAPGKLWN